MDAVTNCLRHDAYPDRKAALAALAAMKASLKRRGVKLAGRPVAYRCAVGRHWHIGRRNGRRGR